MAKEKSKVEFTRVNINLPNNLISRVKKYGDSLGINTTSAYIILLNNALDEKDTLTKIPEVSLSISFRYMSLKNGKILLLKL